MPDPSDDGPAPRIEPFGPVPASPRGVVVVLHGGRSRSREPAHRGLAYLRMLPFARVVKTRETAVYLLRYRFRGWNDGARDALRDAEWAVTELGRVHPGVPIALVGHSMGGRAALGAAGGDGVVAVCALAPWVEAAEPVAQLAGRAVVIAHGDRERMTDPAGSYAYAVHAKQVTDRVARFDVLGDGHAMLRRAGDWSSLVRRFVLGELGIEPIDPEIANAMAEPSPTGLRVELRKRDQYKGAAS
ncbi:alpha/beta hydrolase [Pseudonocardia sulfidoxydans NBRC 16205]|uniref:Alpha/beta hydrolase n=1 Tax=Pseudonocardia sulfidoxydans NBRC 16205 TaxID=1223511 RepID=A0A511DSW6_9PSEU|nr:alpha/beta fold hydrolase [Pseudonocardia sulfidoxydans]GEL26844.1 alpha/beta hydrolase [Pseudonocardia sulfidoxydans NBRC 16205]